MNLFGIFLENKMNTTKANLIDKLTKVSKKVPFVGYEVDVNVAITLIHDGRYLEANRRLNNIPMPVNKRDWKQWHHDLYEVKDEIKIILLENSKV